MIRNVTKNTVVAASPRKAVTFPERLRGMIGRDFRDFDAMIFSSCNAIHTFFMGFPIDVIFADKEKKILKQLEDFPPYRPYAGSSAAYWTIELPGGTLRKSGTQAGDVLEF